MQEKMLREGQWDGVINKIVFIVTVLKKNTGAKNIVK